MRAARARAERFVAVAGLCVAALACGKGSDDSVKRRDPPPAVGEQTSGSPGGDGQARWPVSEGRDDGTEAADALLPPRVAAVKVAGAITEAPWLDGASKVGAIDVGGARRIAGAGAGWLKLFDASGNVVGETTGVGVAQVLAAIDIDRDGTDELVLARGRGRGALDAAASISIYRARDLAAPPETIPLFKTTRAQVVGVARDPDRAGALYVAMFDSKYFARLVRAVRSADGRWSLEQVARVRMAFALAVGDVDGDGKAELAIARPYGDRKPDDGDVLVFTQAGVRSVVPTARGARSIAIGHRKGEAATLYYSDGWHKDYGRKARGLITRARKQGDRWQTAVLANVDGRHSFDHVRTGDVDGDGRSELIASGNGPAVYVSAESERSEAARAIGDRVSWDAFPVDLDGDGRDEVVQIGPRPGDRAATRAWIWRLGQP